MARFRAGKVKRIHYKCYAYKKVLSHYFMNKFNCYFFFNKSSYNATGNEVTNKANCRYDQSICVAFLFIACVAAEFRTALRTSWNLIGTTLITNK